MTSRRKKWGIAVAVAVAASAMATSTQAAGTPAAKSKYGGELNIGIHDTYSTWCVGTIPNHSALGGFRAIYEQLFERTSKGEYVGLLASSGTPNADFTQWTIKIRQGIKFHDGSVLNADVVKLNIDLHSGLYSAQNKDVSATFATPGRGYASTGYGVNANIMNVAKMGEYEIRIDLNQSQNDFLGVLYRAGRYVIRSKSQLVTEDGKSPSPTCGTKPVGTGPFKYVSNTTEQLIVEKNTEYWRTNPANGDKLPYLDRINFINVKEPLQRSTAVRSGTVDIALFPSSDGTFVKDLSKRKSVVTGYRAAYQWFGSWVPNINKANSIFKFKNCRLGVAHAIDWKKFNEVRYKGVGIFSGSIVAKGHPMFTTKGAPKYAPQVAKDYVSKCKADLGGVDPGWSLYADTSSKSIKDAEFLEGYLKAAGFKMGSTDIKEASQHIIDIYANSFGVTQKTLTQGTPAEGGDSAYVSIFFASSAYPTGHKSPVAATATGKYYSKVIALSNVDDPKIDTLISAAQSAKPGAAANAKWKEMTTYLMEEGYQIPTVHGTFFTFVNNKSKIRGIGRLSLGNGKTPEIVTNKGLDLTGLYFG
jgi:ABC-type transport system substrate-binding protein